MSAKGKTSDPSDAVADSAAVLAASFGATGESSELPPADQRALTPPRCVTRQTFWAPTNVLRFLLCFGAEFKVSSVPSTVSTKLWALKKKRSAMCCRSSEVTWAHYLPPWRRTWPAIERQGGHETACCPRRCHCGNQPVPVVTRSGQKSLVS